MLQLATDPASAKAGQALAGPRKWVSSGFDAAAVWGECQGSGSKPYQVQVDLSEPAFKCSCPSRKFPCKHGLGLMLMFAAGQLAEGAPPAWVAEWLAGRAAKSQKKQAKAEAPAKPVDEAAAAKRRERRLKNVADGLAALKRWAEDLVRGGIATAPGLGYAFFDGPARRMIDAQAPGAARRVQDLGTIAASGGEWQRPFVKGLASIYLLARAYERLDELPPATRDDVLSTLGLPVPAEVLAALPATADLWQVVAAEVSLQDRLRVQQTWLFGTRTGRVGVDLAFAHGAGPLDASLPVGTAFEGEVAFYPGNAARVTARSRQELKPITQLAGLANLDALCGRVADHRAAHPWADELSLPVRSLIPTRYGDGWHLIDCQGQSLPMAVDERASWAMMALSGGQAIDVVVAFDGRHLRPLAAMGGRQFVSLVALASEVAT